jgi:hypothetical protein
MAIDLKPSELVYNESTYVPARVPSSDPKTFNNASIWKPGSIIPTELQEHITCVEWLELKGILHFHIPNGGYRNQREGAKFKRMGVKAGIPDLCIPIARKGFHGLYIELKRARHGRESERQKFWIAELKKQGYDVFIAKGASQLIKYVEYYLEI